jgi:hypothetical protein
MDQPLKFIANQALYNRDRTDFNNPVSPMSKESRSLDVEDDNCQDPIKLLLFHQRCTSLGMCVKHIILILHHPSSLKSAVICSGVGNLLTIRYRPIPIGVPTFHTVAGPLCSFSRTNGASFIYVGNCFI